ncbi:asparaginase [uncultured Parasutterella sp.]|uniref:asparaginase n=1 Tax=uncultured Parasutterella sp. TaxID=1263098 RepID=UPI0025B6FAEB|nr:asparaginase [uncultured Parasutterella sp.]
MSAALPRIAILATGGTIAGKASSASQTVGYKPGSASVQDILDSVPGLSDVAEITAVQVANIGSEDMTDHIWTKLVRETEEQLADPEIDGVVITHGTDTLEETAFLLNLILKSDKPIVIVGSMRPATSISADGPMNLLNAVRTACSEKSVGKGVLVVLNDEIHGARDVTKTNTTNCSTFASPRLGALGFVTGGIVDFYKASVKPHTTQTQFTSALLNGSDLPLTDIIYAHANVDSRLIEASAATGAKGIVYAGMGNGSVHINALKGLREAIEKGVIVIRSSRAGSGAVVDSAPEWSEAGMINGGTLNPQKARILLQLCLASGLGREEIIEAFNRY